MVGSPSAATLCRKCLEYIADLGNRELALNAFSLVCGFAGNFFLLLNFTGRVRYIVALPLSIVFWMLASMIVSRFDPPCLFVLRLLTLLAHRHDQRDERLRSPSAAGRNLLPRILACRSCLHPVFPRRRNPVRQPAWLPPRPLPPAV